MKKGLRVFLACVTFLGCDITFTMQTSSEKRDLALQQLQSLIDGIDTSSHSTRNSKARLQKVHGTLTSIEKKTEGAASGGISEVDAYRDVYEKISTSLPALSREKQKILRKFLFVAYLGALEHGATEFVGTELFPTDEDLEFALNSGLSAGEFLQIQHAIENDIAAARADESFDSIQEPGILIESFKKTVEQINGDSLSKEGSMKM